MPSDKKVNFPTSWMKPSTNGKISPDLPATLMKGKNEWKFTEESLKKMNPYFLMTEPMLTTLLISMGNSLLTASKSITIFFVSSTF